MLVSMNEKQGSSGFVQVVVCRKQQGATHEDVKALGDVLQRWVCKQPGFVERRLIRCEDGETYIDVVAWTDALAAETAMKADGHPPAEEMGRVLVMGAMGFHQGTSLALTP